MVDSDETAGMCDLGKKRSVLDQIFILKYIFFHRPIIPKKNMMKTTLNKYWQIKDNIHIIF